MAKSIYLRKYHYLLFDKSTTRYLVVVRLSLTKNISCYYSDDILIFDSVHYSER